MKLYVDDEWSGWSGDTSVRLSDGSVWHQDEYHYEYHYAYRPEATLSNGKMLVKGMNRAVRVRGSRPLMFSLLYDQKMLSKQWL